MATGISQKSCKALFPLRSPKEKDMLKLININFNISFSLGETKHQAEEILKALERIFILKQKS